VFDNDSQRSSPFAGIPIYHGERGFDAWIEDRGRAAGLGFLVAIGGAGGVERRQIHDRLQARGLIPLNAIHPSAFVAPCAELEAGVQILAKAAVCVETKIGACSIVNTSASVDHECRIGSGVHIGPGATLAGCVTVEDYAMIGAGAVVLPRLRIGNRAIVGAGAVITRDVAAGSVVAGNPAQFVREVDDN